MGAGELSGNFSLDIKEQPDVQWLSVTAQPIRRVTKCSQHLPVFPLNIAIEKVKGAADGEAAHALAAKAKATAHNIVHKAKEGALDAAEAFVEANSDPAAMKVRYLHTDLSIVAPSDDIQITRPSAASLVIGDGAGNSLVIKGRGAGGGGIGPQRTTWRKFLRNLTSCTPAFPVDRSA